MTSVIPKPLGS